MVVRSARKHTLARGRLGLFSRPFAGQSICSGRIILELQFNTAVNGVVRAWGASQTFNVLDKALDHYVAEVQDSHTHYARRVTHRTGYTQPCHGTR